MAKNSLYTQVLEIAYDYLGPAAERFINRQIQNNLNKTPSQLDQKDLDKLVDWIQVSVSMLSSDERLINDFISRLQKLSTKKIKPSDLSISNKSDMYASKSSSI